MFLQPPLFPFIANHDIICYGYWISPISYMDIPYHIWIYMDISLVHVVCRIVSAPNPLHNKLSVTQLCVTVMIREGLFASTEVSYQVLFEYCFDQEFKPQNLMSCYEENYTSQVYLVSLPLSFRLFLALSFKNCISRML